MQPILYMPIGVSGCGKSTLFTQLQQQDPTIQYFSWDDLRLKWYNCDYSIAWQMSCEDKQFKQKTINYFRELVKTGDSIYVDNTNLTRKRRRQFLDVVRPLGYKTISIYFDVDITTVISRQSTRLDKYIPESAVMQQFQSLQPPIYGEFDEDYNSESIRIIK